MAELSATTGDEGFVRRRPATGEAIRSRSTVVANEAVLEQCAIALEPHWT